MRRPARPLSILWVPWLAVVALACAQNNPDFKLGGTRFDALPDGLVPDVQSLPDQRPVGPGVVDASADSNGVELERGLVGHWPMEEGQGTSFDDRTSRANHATLTGVVWARPGAPLRRRAPPAWN